MDTRMEPRIRMAVWDEDIRLPFVQQPSSELVNLISSSPNPFPAPFQSSSLPALKRTVWFALQRPQDYSRSGLLIVTGKDCFLVVSGKSTKRNSIQIGKHYFRIVKLNIRIDDALNVAPSVFIATLTTQHKQIWIEDIVTWRGRPLVDNFSARWTLAAKWLESSCWYESRQIGGLEIKMAPWQPLSAMTQHGSWYLQENQMGSRRFMWSLQGAQKSHESHESKGPTATIARGPQGPQGPLESKEPTATFTGPPVALATRDPAPEQWWLSAGDGSRLGRALIRTLAVSDLMRPHTNPVRVHIRWSPTFDKWEILSVTHQPLLFALAEFERIKVGDDA